MYNYFHGIYVLLTSRVPLPLNTMLFSVTTLSAYTVLAPFSVAFTEAGLILPVLCAVFGYVMVVGLNVPATVERFERENGQVIGARAFTVPFILCSLAMFAPTLAWAQHAISLLMGATAFALAGVTMLLSRETKSQLFGAPWDEAKHNTVNWHIARLVALILGNELAASSGSPTNWIIAMCLGPIALHYLMCWTIIATHPYESVNNRNAND